MGWKYSIEFMQNGICPHKFEWHTEYFIKALYWLIKLKIKYPIVTLSIRTGFIDCEDCTADFCDKSKVWIKEE